MENEPIFEWSPWNIVLDEQEYKEDFNNLINDLHHHHNYDNYSNYLPHHYDGDYYRLGSWKAEYAAMDEEGVMIVTYDDISDKGDTSDHEYSSNESKEEKIDGYSEVEEGYDYCGYEEGAYVEEEEKQFQEVPEDKDQSFEETSTGIPRIEAAGRVIYCLEPNIGDKLYETKTGTQFFQIK